MIWEKEGWSTFFRWVGNRSTAVPSVQSPSRGGREWGLLQCWAARGFHGSVVHSAQRSTKKISRDETEIIVVFHMYVMRKMNYPGEIFKDGGSKAVEITSWLEFDLKGSGLKEGRALVSRLRRQAASLKWTLNNTHAGFEWSEGKIVTCSWLRRAEKFYSIKSCMTSWVKRVAFSLG